MLSRVAMHGESGVGVARAMTKMPLLIMCYALEDAYNMDEIGLLYHSQPNKTLAWGNICGNKF